jgi:hypothetical protein
MNERIKLLIEQATTIEYGVDNGFDRVTFDKEKFAELIVRECAQVSREYADKGICSNHYDEVGIECLPSDMEYYVLNYFGVEQ